MASAMAETALGQNALRMRHRPCVELCTPGPGSFSRVQSFWGAFPSFPAGKLGFSPGRPGNRNRQGCTHFPQAHSKRDLRRGAERVLLPLSAHCSFCKWFSGITSKISALSEPTQPGSGLLWQGMEPSNFRVQNHQISFF